MCEWTKEEFTNLTTGMFSSDAWFMVHRGLLGELDVESAFLLHFLINFHLRVKRSRGYRWDNGWFYCTVERMEEEIGLLAGAQIRILKSLSERTPPLIEIAKMKMPARRHIRINCHEISQIILRWMKKNESSGPEIEASSYPESKMTGCPKIKMTNDPENRVTYNSNKKYSNKKENPLSVPDGTDGQCIVPLDGRRGKKICSKFDLKASSEFHRVVSSHIKVNCRSDNKQWANQFRMMREVDGVSRKDIRAAIEWYGRNIGKEFVIEAFSAATFRKKYANGQIPAAMKRMNGCSSGDLEDSNSNGNGVNDSTICKMHEEVSIRLRELNAWTDWPNPPDRKIIDRVVKELGYDDWRGKYLDVSKLN